MDAHDRGKLRRTKSELSEVGSAILAGMPTPTASAAPQLVQGTHHDLVHLHRLLARAARKERWARLVAKKNAQLRSLMCAIRRALGDGFRRRENGPNRTRLFYVQGTAEAERLAVVLYCPTPRSTDDFDAPIKVEVLEPSTLDLSELVQRGDVDLRV